MPTNKATSAYVAVARIFWMAAGPCVLLLLTGQIATSGTGWFTPLDAAFGFTVVALILARCVEFRGGDPRTTDGSPADVHHLRRYGFRVMAIGLSLWVFANLLGNHLLHRA